MITRHAIVEKAREYLGTPFHHQARRKGVGIDCAGLIVCVARELGLPYEDRNDYAWRPDGVTLKQILDSKLQEVGVSEAQPGDVLLLWTYNPSVPAHIGIKTDKGMIHAYAHTGSKRVVETGLDDWWRKRIIHAYQFPGVE